ncbi:MAG: hypothetical protein R3F54_28655 [Alphaproteobacteria bacterium]
MADLPAPVKEWSGPGALAALVFWALAQSSGLVPAGAGKEVQALVDRLDDHDGRIERAWSAINSATQERRALSEVRVGSLERITDRLGDRLDAEKEDSSEIKSTLKTINEAVHEMKRDQAVMKAQLEQIAKQAGVAR